MKDSDGLPLPGSELQVPSTAELIGPCPADTQIEVTVYLRSKDPSGLQEYVEQTSGPGNHVYLTPQQFAHKFGADPADVEAVKNFAEAQQLHVLGHDLGRRSVTLSGTAARLNEAFGVNLQHYRYAGGVYRLRQGSIRIPASFENIITGIFGLDNRPKARAHFRILSKKAAAPGAVTPETYTPLQLAAIYDFPGGFTGQGETIGIIELGGGYNQTDLDNYFQQLGVSPAPSVTAVSVDGATNSPTGDPNGADGEVELDIEVTGSIAPGAAIKVFFAPNTDQGFIDAVTTAVNDSAVTLISISWGGPESTFTTQSMTAFNQAFQDAGTMGKTVFVAAGDNGSSDGESDGANHVDFPASSPFVVGCGGTTLVANTSTDTITSEVVWNETASNEGATGGGVSDFFPKPSYQDSVNVPAPTTQAGGRGVPDVAGDADPVTGYQVIIDGSTTTIGGTSAVAPLYAGLFARINQALLQNGKSRVGSVNAALYQNPSAFHDIVSGNNGAFSAGPGWDPTTGLGSPDGGKILSALGG
ncbi:MAG TPA: S53 family peptidase [Chthoniobacterales bacterium]